MELAATHRSNFLIFLFSCYFLTGCSSSNQSSPIGSTGLPAGSYNYTFAATNLPSLDASYGQYVLWIRMLGDSDNLISIPLNSNNTGIVKLPHGPDSILSSIVSIEAPGAQATLPDTPSSPLMAGQFQTDSGYSILSTTNAGGFGNYSTAAGAAIFTTKSSDTTRAESEFYLMKFVNGVPTTSMSNLPIAPVGWRYGLWVLDSSFYPVHKFFYGSFADASGDSSDSSNSEFPFPGGYNPAPLNDPGATLEITLEPDFSVSGNKPVGPSLFPVLWLQLRQFIYFNQSLNFQNVWNSSPSGVLKIWR